MSETFTHEYTYTAFDQMDTMTYPSGLQITYDYYDGTGFLKGLLDHNGTNIYEPKESNAFGQMTQYTLGNGLTTQVDYDQYGILDAIQTQNSDVFHMSFDIEEQSGLLNSRTDHVINGGSGLTETFIYDDHYRLLSANASNGTALNMTYQANGNINSKSDISDQDYEYPNNRIHAVDKIPNPTVTMPEQSIIYNAAQQPTSITEENKIIDLTYGSDEQRRYTQYVEDGNLQYQRYYCGDFERQVGSDGSIEDVHYLDAGIIVVGDGMGNYDYNYTYGDHLGSILAVTDNNANVTARQSFDAWGRYRDADTWTVTDQSAHNLSWLYRGYTGHEMLPEVNIINMNGRLYDPLVARMLSVDNFAGLDGTSQSYNRYTYANNNPLMYTDPTGEFISAALKGGALACSAGGCGGLTVLNGLSAINTLASGYQLLNGAGAPNDIIIVGDASFRKKVQNELFNLAASSMEGYNLVLDALESNNDLIIIDKVDYNEVKAGGIYGSGNDRGGKIAEWSLDLDKLIRDACDLNGDVTTGMAHEITHFFTVLDESYTGYGKIENEGDYPMALDEPKATAMENLVRVTLGFDVRTYYESVEVHGREVDLNSWYYDGDRQLKYRMKDIPNFKFNPSLKQPSNKQLRELYKRIKKSDIRYRDSAGVSLSVK